MPLSQLIFTTLELLFGEGVNKLKSMISFCEDKRIFTTRYFFKLFPCYQKSYISPVPGSLAEVDGSIFLIAFKNNNKIRLVINHQSLIYIPAITLA